MSLEIVTYSNQVPHQPYYYFRQYQDSLKRFGVHPTILGMGDAWKGLMTKPRAYRSWLSTKAKTDLVMLTDAWDILVAAHPEEIEARYRSQFQDLPVVLNAEKSCFPRGDLAERFPDPGTPWRYLNSGLIIGKPTDILAVINSMNIDQIPDDHRRSDGSWFHPNDQEHFTLAYLNQPVKMVLDTHCHLFQSFSGASPVEFDFTTDRIRNLITGTDPLVYHCNGDAKNNHSPTIIKKLGL